MRRAPHDGQNPRRLQLKASSLSCPQAQEAVRQDVALQEGVELVTDELRQPGTGALFGLGEERRGMLLHQAVQRGLLGAATRAVDRGAIAMRPPGVVSVGLHALGRRIWGGAATLSPNAQRTSCGRR